LPAAWAPGLELLRPITRMSQAQAFFSGCFGEEWAVTPGRAGR
jgi:hypothetical protein